MELSAVCQFKWKALQSWCEKEKSTSFSLMHRIHPAYVSENYQRLVETIDGVTLVVVIDFNGWVHLI